MSPRCMSGCPTLRVHWTLSPRILSKGWSGCTNPGSVSYTHLRLKDKQLTVSLTPAAKDYVVEQGFDPIYGARPLKRFLQRKVETLIGRMIIAEDLLPNTHLEVDYDRTSDKLVVNKK